MANINTDVTEIYPQAGADLEGRKKGYLADTVKAAQDDTVTIQNVTEVIDADLRVIATGVSEPYTISGNVLTLTSATAGSVRGEIYYK